MHLLVFKLINNRQISSGYYRATIRHANFETKLSFGDLPKIRIALHDDFKNANPEEKCQ